jgi:hypothetical protein
MQSKNLAVSERITEITEENKHLLPKNLQEAYEYLTNIDIASPEGYYKAQKSMLIEETQNLFLRKPEMPPRKVLLKILRDLPDFLPVDNLKEVTDIILNTWIECQTQIKKLQPAS